MKDCVIDKKFENENYMPTVDDVKNLNNDEANELYSIVRLDFDAYDDLRSYEIDCGKWSEENEIAWFNAHKRYILTRRLLSTFCGLSFNYDYDVDDFNKCDTVSELYNLKKNVQREFYYSRNYDNINSFVWNNEYQTEYNKLKDALHKIDIKINELKVES